VIDRFTIAEADGFSGALVVIHCTAGS